MEDDLPETEDPQWAPVGYVETLPAPAGKKRPRKVRKNTDVVKIGWASERVNRRAKGK